MSTNTIDNQQRIERMTDLLNQSLAPTKLEIIDDSHLHAGHAGAKSGKGHFTVIIQSGQFEGLGRVKQQQLVYQALGDMMQTDIHALVIKIT
ncbi:BolA family protein [Aliikangiella coralliicola]|uniref:BolA family transcriptional regulator n=1 Tax=Aliikangiella coralliicola TaxID=2592383 RepID=A0A545UDC8_9GAMM|nr:BolA family protein [Aliikangiella coralliicola]TQV87467.1 BolA family transcriptional regulator [Aliikangiella coralliicola]